MIRKIYGSILAAICLMGCGSSQKKIIPPPPVEAIAVNSGSSQSATVNTAFAAPLVAKVTTGGTATSGVVVTFTAPATGASGTFAGGVNTATTDANGLATSAVFTANGTAGAYTVAATAAGVSTPANFSLTNTAVPVESIAVNSGSSQTATVNTAFAAPLVAKVTTGGTPTSGVVVTFTAPGTGASGTFAGGVNTATTDANGLATSAVFTANGTAGAYTVAATVSGVSTPANFSLTNTAVPVNHFSFYLSGLEVINQVGDYGPNFYAVAGSVAIDADGNVLAGEQDYNNAFGVTSPQPSGDAITGGKLTVVDATTGKWTLTLITNNTALGAAGTETLGVQFVNTKHALITQFDGSATSSGSMDMQTLPSTLGGGYSFTFSGVDSDYDPEVGGGVFSITGTALQNGVLDVDVAGTVALATAFTGTILAPDSSGRGTITVTGASGVTAINYYIVGPEVIRIIDVDPEESFVGSAYGQGASAGTFTNASLGSSVFGVESNPFGYLYAAAGMLTTTPAGNAYQGVADNNELGYAVVSAAAISGTYSVAGNGYGNLTDTSENLEDVTFLGIYMTDPNLNLLDPNNTTSGLGGALVADLDEFAIGTGVLIPQTVTATDSFAGNYAFGAQGYTLLNTAEGWEFDFVGQGSVTDGVLGGTGLLSDASALFDANPTNTGVTFSGTAVPDEANAGRYTMFSPSPLVMTVVEGSPFDFQVVLYQASGGQLLFLNEDNDPGFFGSLQQQGSLTDLLATSKVAAKTNLQRKH